MTLFASTTATNNSSNSPTGTAVSPNNARCNRLVSLMVVTPAEGGASSSSCYQLSVKIPTVLFRRETLAWILVIFLNVWIVLSHMLRNNSSSTISIHQKNIPPPLIAQQDKDMHQVLSPPTATMSSSMVRTSVNNGTKTFQDISSTTPTTITRVFHGTQNELALQEGYDALEDGNCWCTAPPDNFCSCTPSLAVDIILRAGSSYVWLIEHKESGKLGCLGGFVEVGETTEEAVARVLKEEIFLLLKSPPRLFGVYGDPRRDRTHRHHHTISVVYIVDVPEEEHQQTPVIMGDDRLDVVRIQVDVLDRLNYFLDHKTILKDYKKSIAGTSGISKDYGATFLYDRPVKRAVCH